MQAAMQRWREDPLEVARAHPLPEPYRIAPTPPAPRRWRRLGWVAVPLAAGLAGAAWLALPGSAAVERDRVLDAARVAGLPETLAEIESHPAPEDNAAPLLREAISSVDPDTPMGRWFESVASWQSARDSVSPMRPAILPTMDRFLLPKLESVARRRDLSWERSRGVGWLQDVSEASRTGDFVRYLGLSAIRRAEEGDAEGALHRLRVGARLSFLTGRDPYGIPLGLRQEERLIRDAQRVISVLGPRPELLDGMRGWLDGFEPIPSTREAFQADWVQGREFFRDLARGRIPFEDLGGFWREGWPQGSDLRRDAQTAFLTTNRGQAESERDWAAIHLDYFRALPNDPSDFAGYREATDAARRRTARLSGTRSGWVADLFVADLTYHQLDAARTLARRRAFGALLDSLAGARKPLPRDPFASGPLRRRVGSDGSVRVWSVGQDGSHPDDVAVSYP